MNFQPNYMQNNGYYGMYGMNGMNGMNGVNAMNNNMQQQIPRYQQETPQYTQPQPVYKPVISLQGKTVDSIDVVKATDIPLDGSVSYFPIVDGSAIVTKQLQQDGTSKIIIYKPVDGNEVKEESKFVTVEEFNERLKGLDNEGFKDDLKDIKRKIEDFEEDINNINKDLKKRKD